MMKLTVAFLGALAVADAASPRGHRHVRRQYGYGNGPTPGNSTTTLPPAGTTDVSPELPTSSSSVTLPGVTFPGSGTAPGTAPATEVNTDKPTTLPGVTYPGSGTAPAATDVATPLPETTSLSPVGGNTTSAFPTFVLTGTEGSFPTAVPSGMYPTGTGAEDLVTLTISSTQIFTVTACPSSVTNCPAKSTSLVTSVVAVGTTVCPESEASSIVESGLPSSATATKTGASSVEAVATPVPSEVVEDKTEVLTQTIGTGENAHETKITITSKVTKTIYVTGDASVPVTTSVSPEQTGGADEPTTYVTSDVTSTVAKTLTITEGAPSGTGSPSNGSPSGVPVNPEDTPVNPSGGAEECAPPVTVTVTAQETVTVTAGDSTPTGTDTPANPGEVPSEDTTTISPEQPTNTAIPQHPTGGAPYPTLNGTAPHFPGSSGFLTATKPSGAIPTGGAPGYGAPAPSGSGAVPSGEAPTETLPSFVLPSATPAGETTTSVSPDAPPPAETSAYGDGYGYGSKKRAFFGLF